MKNFYIEHGLQSDVAVTWDIDEEIYLVSVAHNRLPMVSEKENDILKDSQSLSRYLEKIRVEMKPIGLPSDGVSKRFFKLSEVNEFLKNLEKEGYRLPFKWESLIEDKVVSQKSKKDASWNTKKQVLSAQSTLKKKASKKKGA